MNPIRAARPVSGLRCLALTAGSCAALASAPAHAQTNVAWRIGMNGDWSDPARWMPMSVPNNGVPPGVTYNATIDVVGTYTVSLDDAFTVTGFRLNSGMAKLMGVPASSLTTTGLARLSAGGLVGIPLFESLGTLQFDNLAAIEVCDSCIGHRGSIIIWDGTGDIALDQGSEIINDAGSTFNITNDAIMRDLGGGGVPILNNMGTMQKTAGIGATTIDGVQFLNSGTLIVSSGSVVITNPPVSLGRLADGDWEADGASIDFDGVQVMETSADISLDGQASMFIGLEPLETILPGGSLSLSTRRNFTTTTLSDFTNDGLIRTDVGTFFQVAPGRDLTNFNPATGELLGGAYDITGRVTFDDADVATLSADVTLNTIAASFTDPAGQDALRNLSTLSTGAALGLLEGKDLIVSDDLVTRGAITLGRNAAGDESILEIPTALIQEDGDVILQGGRVRVGGAYLFQDGKLSGDGEVEGDVLAGGEIAPGASPGLLSVVGQVVELSSGRISLEIGGTLPVIEHDVLRIEGPLLFQGGQAGTLEVSLLGTFMPQIGDQFQVIQARAVDGQFAELRGLAITPDVRFIPELGPTGVVLHVDRICICDIAAPLGKCDIFDFLAFQDQFINGGGGLFDVCNLDTASGREVCDIFDFLAFQDLFVLGCR